MILKKLVVGDYFRFLKIKGNLCSLAKLDLVSLKLNVEVFIVSFYCKEAKFQQKIKI